LKRVAAWIAGIAVVLAAAAYAALELSPWPAALVYRGFMNRGGEGLNWALEPHVPDGVTAVLDQPYDTDDDALLDVYYPSSVSRPLPAIVWLHGGGFLSGSKAQVANYLKILAARGYVTVAVGYSLGPASHYPTPVRQANTALAYLAQNAKRLHIDPDHFFLAGDSAGAQLAAQLANVISAPSYAKAVDIAPSIRRAQLRGTILHCGVYDLGLAKLDGAFGHFMRTVVWSYSGRRQPGGPALPDEFSVARFVTADFPPTFISAGNADPLLPHSRALADALTARGVKVDSLFFPDDFRPRLPHEYQFNLDHGAGWEALERSVRFLKATAY
jgi:acetyl esterase/lipase